MAQALEKEDRFAAPIEKITVLAVDDEDDVLDLLEHEIKQMGHDVLLAHSGQDALHVLETEGGKIDVVLMDRMMPGLDGLSAVKRINENPDLRHIPIVMITGEDTAQAVKEGIEAGVFYYLTKPFENIILNSVLSSAVRKARQGKVLREELAKHRTGFDLIETCKFKFQTIAEAESLAAFIAHCFPDPERALQGLGELLVNAVEHGNLGLGHERKAAMVESGRWREEIEALQNAPEHKDKYASATLAQKEDGIYVVIEDEGAGFDWKQFMKIDPVRAGSSHGRGIAQANAASFDKLTYNKAGNKAVAFVSRKNMLEW